MVLGIKTPNGLSPTPNDTNVLMRIAYSEDIGDCNPSPACRRLQEGEVSILLLKRLANLSWRMLAKLRATTTLQQLTEAQQMEGI